METKHTPGPWRVGTFGPDGCYTVGTEQGLMTAKLAHSINLADQREQAIANAHLVAAAPDLLVALDAMVKRIEYYSGLADDVRPNIEQWEYAEGSKDMRVARAAIAKATGEPA